MKSFKHLLLDTGYKPNKAMYYIRGYLRFLFPSAVCRTALEKELKKIERYDKAYIYHRVNYYIKTSLQFKPGSDFVTLPQLRKKHKSTYLIDTYEYRRYFDPAYRTGLIFGDNTINPALPSICKSRPVRGGENCVLLKLNKIRHYIFLNDKKPFKSKKDMIVWRGHVGNKRHRRNFVERYCEDRLCDVGEAVVRVAQGNEKWKKSGLSLSEQLRYKFICAIEGNDVATSLKWIMSSNSIAVMAKPKYETWFMEGRLRPEVHYIEVADDYSDMVEKIRYYITRPDVCRKIIENQHAYIEQFRNHKREKLIALMVLDRYFKLSGKESG